MADKKKGLFGTPFVILSFVLVFLVLFDYPKGLRDGTAWVAGLILAPLIGFGGRYPLLTIFLASVVLVIATTAIRHFLTDWTKLARMQEAMRAFSKEMKDARKSNNTYKLKKLTEAQQDLMSLQADAQTEQMKPMALTMLLVIPIFAWLGAWLAVPILFDAPAAPEGTYALVGIDYGEADYATIVEPSRDSFSINDGVTMYALRLDANGTDAAMSFTRDVRGGTESVATDAVPQLPPATRIGAIESGTHVLRLELDDMTLTDEMGARTVGRTVVLLDDPAGWRAFVVGTHDVTVTTEGGDLYVIVPGLGGAASITGTHQLAVGDDAYTLSSAALVPMTQPATEILPIPVKSPWDATWDIMDPYTWITGNPGWFPRWIVLYSLFGIPFGQIAQRALKLWEYRHVDLDADGIPAGRHQ